MCLPSLYLHTVSYQILEVGTAWEQGQAQALTHHQVGPVKVQQFLASDLMGVDAFVILFQPQLLKPLAHILCVPLEHLW